MIELPGYTAEAEFEECKQHEKDVRFMQHALILAETAARHNEVPVGAIVVRNDMVIGQGVNQVISAMDPSAHAEMVALRVAAKTVQNYRLSDATLYSTIEPCTMCLGVIIHSRIHRVVYGALEPKSGAVHSNPLALQQGCFNHRPAFLGHVLNEECSRLMSSFFKTRRKLKAQLKKD